jgi:hypothetical protein
MPLSPQPFEMERPADICPPLLAAFLLGRTQAADAQAALHFFAFASCAREDLPPLPRALLDHERGMTATLVAHWQESMQLRVLALEEGPDRLYRQVALVGARTGQVAELGIIDLDLARLPPDAALAVRAAHRPFGAALAACGFAFRSIPQGFFSLLAQPPLNTLLACPVSARLYGRTARLIDSTGTPLGEVVEILP